MKIGILSDTHGNVARTATAAEVLLGRGADALIHCGDIGSLQAFELLQERCGSHGVSLYAVLGNVDLYNPDLSLSPARNLSRFLECRLDGRDAAILHGDDGRAWSGAVEAGRYTYVFSGHTHAPEDRTIGTTRLINPGAVTRARHPTVAILDLDCNALEYLPLDLRER